MTDTITTAFARARRRRIAALAVCLLLGGCAQGHAVHERIAGIAPLPKDAVASVDIGSFETGRFIASDGSVLPYRLLRPPTVEAGKRYPLVLQFHGSGGIGTDNLSQLDRLAKSWALPAVRERHPTYVLVPQFPIRSANYGPAAPDQASDAAPALKAALELARSFAAAHPVDTGRVYTVGFSMGGSAAWWAPILDPALFAASVPISGIAPCDAHAAALRDLPLLIMHGDADLENPITADRRFFAALQTAGAGHIRFREYTGLAHQLPDDIQPGHAWRDWLFQQRRATHGPGAQARQGSAHAYPDPVHCGR